MALPLPYGVGLVDPQCPIDWSHPLNFGLVGDWTVTPNSGWRGGNAVVDLVRGGKLPHDSAWVSTRNWASPLGRRGGYGSIQTNGTSSYTASATVPGVNGATYLSYATWVYRSATGVINAWGRTESDAGANKAFGCIWFSNDQIYVTCQNGSNDVYQNTDPITTTGWHHVCVVFDGTQSTDATRAKLYVNAKLVAYTGSSGTVPTTVVSDTKGWGWGTDRSGRYGVGNYDSMQLYLRALTLTDTQQILVETSAGNPNRWRWLLKGAWFPSTQVAGGSPYSLTAGQGTYTLSGQTVNLRAARTIAAAQGTYTLSGQTATLRVARTIAAGHGTYSLTGQNVSLIAARTLAAGQGTYSLSGQTAGLHAARTLTAASGTYTLSGQDATLTYTHAGAYTLAAGVGTYSLSGQSAGLTATRTLAAGSGTYTLSGQSVGLFVGHTLLAGPGNYSLAGQAAGLTVTRTLALATGTYTLTGQAATLSYSGTVEITSPGGVFRRHNGLSRVFRRYNGLTRIFRRNPEMASILATTIPIDTNESRAFIFDFSGCDEALAGETLVSATVPAVSGVTIGTPAVLAAATNYIPIGLGVKVTLSVASAATYDIECRGVFSGGATVVIKGELVGE